MRGPGARAAASARIKAVAAPYNLPHLMRGDSAVGRAGSVKGIASRKRQQKKPATRLVVVGGGSYGGMLRDSSQEFATTLWITWSFSKYTTKPEYSQREMGGLPTGGVFETGAPN